MNRLKAGAGEGQPNRKSDVITVQILLNKWIVPGGVRLVSESLDVDGLCGPKTKAAIAAFRPTYPVEFLPFPIVMPEGLTLKKLDGPMPDHLFPMPGPGGGPAPRKPCSKPKKTGLTQAEREKVEELIREHGLSGTEATMVREIVNNAGDVVSVLGQLDDALEIVESLRWAGGIGQVSTASAILGIIGPIFMFIGFVCVVNDMMERDAKHDTAIAIAFWLVSWAHDRPVPKGCATN